MTKRPTVLLAVLIVALAPLCANAGAPISWFEIYVSDLTRAESFYGPLLGWTFKENPAWKDFHYIFTTSADTADVKKANGALIHSGDRVNDAFGTVVYAQTPNICEVFNHALALGAKAKYPVGVIPGSGTYAVLRDLDGNLFGLASDDATCTPHNACAPQCVSAR